MEAYEQGGNSDPLPMGAVQLRWLAAMPKVTGAISLVASTLIILSICRDRRKLRKTYHRLVLGMSISDWITSFAIFLSTWLIPRGYSDFSFPGSDTLITVPWAIGTDGTCQLQAALMQFAQTTVLYGVSMALFFMLIIQFRWRDARIQRLEPLLHAIPILWGICSAVGGHSAGLFGVGYPFCWMEHSNKRALIARWVIVFVPAWINMTVVSCFCLSIYFHVRKIDRKSKRFRFPAPEDAGEEFGGGAPAATGDEGSNRTIEHVENSSEETEPDVESGRVDPRRSSSILGRRRSSLGTSFSFLSRKSRHQRRLEKYRRTREVASQCFLFAGSFFIVWIPTTVSYRCSSLLHLTPSQ